MIKWFIVGGAGFIGSHFVDKLLEDTNNIVTIYDNFSSGRHWHYEHHYLNNNFKVINGNIEDSNLLKQSMSYHDVVIHLASNPDISKAITDPSIDFRQGTALTENVLEAMRQTKVNRILYASGSGVYGDIGEIEAQEDRGPLLPISTYGASKLSGEVLIHSYCYMFGISGCAFRFGNVVGSRQTHGICYDFIKNLLNNPNKLTILGNGTQKKSYIYVTDVVNAVLLANQNLNKNYEVYNVATKDYITVKEISELVLENMKLKDLTLVEYLGGDRGWKGDVPIVKLNSDRIRNLGWKNNYPTKDAVNKSILDLINNFKNKKM